MLPALSHAPAHRAGIVLSFSLSLLLSLHAPAIAQGTLFRVDPLPTDAAQTAPSNGIGDTDADGFPDFAIGLARARTRSTGRWSCARVGPVPCSEPCGVTRVRPARSARR
jgi:hypothetical protein